MFHPTPWRMIEIPGAALDAPTREMLQRGRDHRRVQKATVEQRNGAVPHPGRDRLRRRADTAEQSFRREGARVARDERVRGREQRIAVLVGECPALAEQCFGEGRAQVPQRRGEPLAGGGGLAEASKIVRDGRRPQRDVRVIPCRLVRAVGPCPRGIYVAALEGEPRPAPIGERGGLALVSTEQLVVLIEEARCSLQISAERSERSPAGHREGEQVGAVVPAQVADCFVGFRLGTAVEVAQHDGLRRRYAVPPADVVEVASAGALLLGEPGHEVASHRSPGPAMR